ncbi:hypothetical protein G6F22_021802 [Rhizopus arrhizus]|nr:hypothetical protein G6F22_021802 [Rhizopus arrhizus]
MGGHGRVMKHGSTEQTQGSNNAPSSRSTQARDSARSQVRQRRTRQVHERRHAGRQEGRRRPHRLRCPRACANQDRQ